MLKHLSALATAGTIISLNLVAAASAQVPVTYVSGKGTDSGACDNKASPCRTFQYAVDHTQIFGEVEALEPADYGPITISNPISITGVDGAGIFLGEAASPPKAAIDIEAGPVNGPVHLTRLTLDGNWRGVLPSSRVFTGILVNSPGIFTITHCTVRNFLGIGIDVHGTNAGFLIADTLVSDNDTAINVSGQTNSIAQGVLDHVWAHRNRSNGLVVYGPSHVTAVDITVTENTRIGISIGNNGDLTLAHSTIMRNEEDGIYIVPPIAGVLSFGDNYITGNGADIYGGTLTHVGAQ